jgi:hypothetical protein
MNNLLAPMSLSIALTLSTGCEIAPKNPAASNNSWARQQLEEARKDRLAREIQIQHVRNLQEHWEALKQGMTIDEVNALIGPFPPAKIQYAKSFIGSEAEGSSIRERLPLDEKQSELLSINLYFSLKKEGGSLELWQKSTQ